MKKARKIMSFLITIILLITMFPIKGYAATSHSWVKDEQKSNKHMTIYSCPDCDETRTVIDHGQIQTVKATEYYPDLNLNNDNGGNLDIITCAYCKENNYNNEFEGGYYYDTSTWNNDSAYHVVIPQRVLNKNHYYVIFKIEAGTLEISSESEYINKDANGQLLYVQGNDLRLDIGEDTANYTQNIFDIDTTKPYYELITYLATGDDSSDYTLTVIKSGCNHDFKYIEKIESTCQTEGYDLYRCSKCNNEIRKNTIPKKEHQKGDWKVIEEPTCKDEGLKAKKCIVCGEILDRQTLSKTNNHSWNEDRIVVEPTYESDGIKEYTCSMCNTTKTENIPKLIRCDHNYEYVSNNNGTHTIKCSKCEYTEKENCNYFNYGYGDYCCNKCGYAIYKSPTYTSVTTNIYTTFGYDNGSGAVSEYGIPLDDFGTISVNGVETSLINNNGEFTDKQGSENSHWSSIKSNILSPNDCKIEVKFNLNHTNRAYRIENIKCLILDKDDDLPLKIKNLSQNDLTDNKDGTYSLFLTKDDYSYYGKMKMEVSFCCDYINRSCNISLVDENGNPLYTEINGDKYNFISERGINSGMDLIKLPVEYYTLIAAKSDYPNEYVTHHDLNEDSRYALSIDKATNRDINITYIYRRNTDKLKIKYIDKDTGIELLPEVNKTVEQGSEVDFQNLTSQEIKGYAICDILGDTSSIFTSDREIIVYYEKNSDSEMIDHNSDCNDFQNNVTPQIRKPAKTNIKPVQTSGNYLSPLFAGLLCIFVSLILIKKG